MSRLAMCMALLTGAVAATGHAAADQSGNFLLVGTWTWTRPSNGCVEVYDYRADGRAFVQSGSERSENRYSLSGKRLPSGFYRLSATIVKDYGGTDCADSDTDDTGAAYVNYLRFSPAGSEYLACYEESLDSCFGPLRRVMPEQR